MKKMESTYLMTFASDNCDINVEHTQALRTEKSFSSPNGRQQKVESIRTSEKT